MHLVIYVKSIRSLDFMPARYTLVEWEPWHSMKMHQLPVDNFIVYYLVDDEKRTVTVVRIFYGGRDIDNMNWNHGKVEGYV